MSLAALPLTIIPFILYNLLTIMGIDLNGSLVGDGITMMSGGIWKLTWGDLLLLIGIVVLFIEIVKATYTGTASMIDHGLSMIVFIAFLVQFLLLMISLIDVIAGFTIGIRVAKRDIGFGGDQ
jgi:hypothetical protein